MKFLKKKYSILNYPIKFYLFLFFLVEFDNRNSEFKKQQKTWLDQQMHEKEMLKRMENERQSSFAAQSFLINRMKYFLKKSIHLI